MSYLNGFKDEMSSEWLHTLDFMRSFVFRHTYVKILKSFYKFCFFYFTVQSESGCANVVSAAPCLAEPQQYEVQFGRLRNFLTGKSKNTDWLFWSLKWVKGNIVKFEIMSLNNVLISSFEISVKIEIFHFSFFWSFSMCWIALHFVDGWLFALSC